MFTNTRHFDNPFYFIVFDFYSKILCSLRNKYLSVSNGVCVCVSAECKPKLDSV